MLNIYTSIEKAKQLSTLEIAPDIENRFLLRLTKPNEMFKDTLSTKILEQIEGMTERKENGYIVGKFGDVHLKDISTGGKGLLLAVNYRDEFIIDIDELGYNCVFLLFEIAKTLDISVISTRVLYHMQPHFEATVNGKRVRHREISREMERAV